MIYIKQNKKDRNLNLSFLQHEISNFLVLSKTLDSTKTNFILNYLIRFPTFLVTTSLV